jgi:hypothetical protein
MGLVGLRPGGWKAWRLKDSVVFGIPAFRHSGFPAVNPMRRSSNYVNESQIAINA